MRLILGPCGPTDAARLTAELADPATAAAFFAAPRSPGPPDAGYWSCPGTLTWVGRVPTGDMVGAFCLQGDSLAYLVRRDWRGQGFGHALAAAACGRVAPALGRDRLHARVLRDNRASVRVLERAGFRFGGFDADEPVACLAFSLDLAPPLGHHKTR